MATTWNGCKVFTATKARDREELGEVVTAWLAERPEVDVVEATVRQSSDNAYHCVTLVLFYRTAIAGGAR